MFPCTYSSPLGRVDNLVIIPEIRLNKHLQLCNQYDTLNVAREDFNNVSISAIFANLA